MCRWRPAVGSSKALQTGIHRPLALWLAVTQEVQMRSRTIWSGRRMWSPWSADDGGPTLLVDLVMEPSLYSPLGHEGSSTWAPVLDTQTSVLPSPEAQRDRCFLPSSTTHPWNGAVDFSIVSPPPHTTNADFCASMQCNCAFSLKLSHFELQRILPSRCFLYKTLR